LTYIKPTYRTVTNLYSIFKVPAYQHQVRPDALKPHLSCTSALYYRILTCINCYCHRHLYEYTTQQIACQVALALIKKHTAA